MALDFKKIKRLFVVEDENAAKNTNPENSKKEPVINTSTETVKTTKVSYSEPARTTFPANETITSGVSTTQGQFNDKVFEQLTKAIAGANLPGEDYLEFVESLKAMENIPLDESIKIQTVLATSSTRGLTLEKVYDSANYYLKILMNEKDKFDIALAQKTDGDIKGKEKELADLDRLNGQKLEQIEILKQEIEKNKEEALRLKNQINEATQKIQETVDSFNFTYDVVVKQITSTVAKIKSVAGN